MNGLIHAGFALTLEQAIMQKNMLVAVGSGGLSAVASMTFFTGSPAALLLVYASMLPLFLVAFGMGYTASVMACGAGLLTAFGLGGAANAVSYGILHAFPVWLVCRYCLNPAIDHQGKRSWAPVGDILGVITLASAAIIIVGSVYIAGDISNIQSMLTAHITKVFTIMGLDVGNAEFASLLNTLVTVFPAAIGVSWIIMTALNALLAQNLLAWLKKNLRPNPSIADMSLPQWVAVPMIGAAMVTLATTGEVRYLAQNLTIVLAVPFFFLGLTVTHWAFCYTRGYRIPLTIGLFIVLLVSGWALVIVAAIGMAEQWWGLKDRFSQDIQQ